MRCLCLHYIVAWNAVDVKLCFLLDLLLRFNTWADYLQSETHFVAIISIVLNALAFAAEFCSDENQALTDDLRRITEQYKELQKKFR